MSEVKAREWWLFNNAKGVDAIEYLAVRPDPSIEHEFTRVVEGAALDAALERVNEFKENYGKVLYQLKKLHEENEKLKAENERLRLALEGLTNAALAKLKPLDSQVDAAFEALKAVRNDY